MDPSSYPVILPDNFLPYPPEAFCIPSFYKDDVESIIIPEGLIRDRIKGIGREIFRLYASSATKEPEPLVLVCVLKSSFKFFCALQEEIERVNSESPRVLKHPQNGNGGIVLNGNGQNVPELHNGLSLPLLCEFIRVKSYVNTKSDTGHDVQIHGVMNPEEAFSNKNVLIVEDIIDSGRTMHALVRNLRQYNVKSLRVVSMLWKRVAHVNPALAFIPDFYGFEIPDRFVIGFGMDYNEKFRDLNHLCVISETGIKKYASGGK